MNNYPELHMLIGGERILAGGRRTQSIINPATEEVLGELPLASAADLDRALATAQQGFTVWRDTPPHDRAAVLLGAAQLLRERTDSIARNATLEQGKTLMETRIEVSMVVHLFEFYAGECLRIYGRTLARPAGVRATVMKLPVGPVAAFAPWNFPIGNPGRKLGAPIAAGCSVIMKAAEETPASALAVLQALYDAGLPREVAQAVFGVPDEVSRHLLASPIIRKLSFTGSTTVGKQLMKLAVDDMKLSTMELGGHAPVLVFADADLEKALNTVVPHKFRNAGQVCISPTRFIVHKTIYQQFIDGFIQRAKALKVGNGIDQGINMGPMANARRLQAMDRFIGDAVAKGATLHTGGERTGERGFFYAPTVLSNVAHNADIMNEEPFGPVALINSFATDDEAIAEANRLPYGLAAYAWTENARRQALLARQVESGMLGINTSMIGAADAPFGGMKWSGHGKEDGPEGVEACLISKTVHEA